MTRAGDPVPARGLCPVTRAGDPEPARHRAVTLAPLSRRALSAALAVAAREGLRCDDPQILRDASNLLVLLKPAPVVARVTTVTSLFRPGDAWLAREVAMASHLAAAGAPVVPPSAELDPGPHHHDGLVLSFWTYVDEADRELDAREAGRRLRVCHDALVGFDGADLPRLAVLDEADALLESLASDGALGEDDAALLRRAGRDARERIEELALPMQPIHGDGHLSNVLAGPDGPLWNDWEDCFLGPRAWDLGCMFGTARMFGADPVPAAAAYAGYGPAFDEATLGVFVDARRYQGTLVSVLMDRVQPHRDRAGGLLAWYRERA